MNDTRERESKRADVRWISLGAQAWSMQPSDCVKWERSLAIFFVSVETSGLVSRAAVVAQPFAA